MHCGQHVRDIAGAGLPTEAQLGSLAGGALGALGVQLAQALGHQLAQLLELLRAGHAPGGRILAALIREIAEQREHIVAHGAGVLVQAAAQRRRAE